VTIRTLLVEDNENNRYLATFLLEANGQCVTHASDGPGALKAVEQQHFDLILLDVQLPGMDGYAVARALRKSAGGADVPIVAVTSYAMSGDREKALGAGCDGYIEKPINPLTFVKEVSVYLRTEPGSK